MIPILYWLIWTFAFLATGMLYIWHLPYYPLTVPGRPPGDDALLMLIIAFFRWLGIAVLIPIASTLWLGRRPGTSAYARRVVPVVLIAGHALLGLTNVWVWERWLSAGTDHTPAGDKALAATYFAIPLTVLAALAIAKWVLPSEPETADVPAT